MIGREFIAIAVQLRSTRSEAAHRTRISRAYYAAFLEARQFVGDHAGMKRVRSSATHRLVAEALATFDPQFQIDLSILRGMRNGADYDVELSPETLALQADQATILAASIIHRLDSHVAQGGIGEVAEAVTSLRDLTALFPANTGDRDDVSLILLSYPELPSMVSRAIPVIKDVVPGASISLDTRTYDDWESPLRLLIGYSGLSETEIDVYQTLLRRLRSEVEFDSDLIQIVLMFAGETGEHVIPATRDNPVTLESDVE